MSKIRPNPKGDGLLIPNSTQIPNVLLDRLMPICSPAIWKVVCCVARQTYGWKKEWEAISISTVMEKTGLSNRKVIDTMELLADATIILRGKLTEWGYEYGINEDPDFDRALDMLKQAERSAREKPSGGRKKGAVPSEPSSQVGMNPVHQPSELSTHAASSQGGMNSVHGEAMNQVHTYKPTVKPTIQTKGKNSPALMIAQKQFWDDFESSEPQVGTYIPNPDRNKFERFLWAANRRGLTRTQARQILEDHPRWKNWKYTALLDSQQEIDFPTEESA